MLINGAEDEGNMGQVDDSYSRLRTVQTREKQFKPNAVVLFNVTREKARWVLNAKRKVLDDWEKGGEKDVLRSVGIGDRSLHYSLNFFSFSFAQIYKLLRVSER